MLFPNYDTAWKSFLCPSARDRQFKPKAESHSSEDKEKYPFDPLYDNPNKKERISYSYAIDGTDQPNTEAWTENAKSTVRISADKKAAIKIPTDADLYKDYNHKRDGRNLLYHDGHVKWKAGGDKGIDPDEDDDDVGDPGWDKFRPFWSDPLFYNE